MLRTDIQLYIDGNGLVAPAIIQNKQGRASDNGVMFTAEYLIMLIRNKEIDPRYLKEILFKFLACMPSPGLLSRAPGDVDQEGPDDYIGLAAALGEIQTLPGGDIPTDTCKMTARTIARSVVLYGIEHLGDMNNEKPGHWSWGAWLARQPQLTACYLWASGLPVGFVLQTIVALIILFSCKGTPADQADPRRLGWLLVQIAAPRSLLCRLASKLWYARLYALYPNGMKDIAAMYYEKGHPFAQYWVDQA